MNEKIFVQVASYRDPELAPTIKDCLEKAKRRENLRLEYAGKKMIQSRWMLSLEIPLSR